MPRTRPTTPRRTAPGRAPDRQRRTVDVPEVGPREPCPCGSGKRYKICHGKQVARQSLAAPTRPFEGLPDEADWIALREIVPAATVPLTLAGENAGREAYAATLLPMVVPALVRQDGRVWLGVQTVQSSGDPSADLAHALLAALAADPGSLVAPGLPERDGPRLQDVLDPSARLRVTVHERYDFWVAEAGELAPEVAASMEQANAAVVPTARLAAVDAAYWCRIGEREHLRWVLPHDEEPLLDALARLHAAGADRVGEGTRLLGTFRAHGRLVPVWDLVPGTPVEELEEPAAAFAGRLGEALAAAAPLTPEQRRARAGLANRQVTIR